MRGERRLAMARKKAQEQQASAAAAADPKIDRSSAGPKLGCFMHDRTVVQ
jgi:hypothetical protein